MQTKILNKHTLLCVKCHSNGQLLYSVQCKLLCGACLNGPRLSARSPAYNSLRRRHWAITPNVLLSNPGCPHCADMQATRRLSRDKAEAWFEMAKGRKAEGLSARDLILLR